MKKHLLTNQWIGLGYSRLSKNDRNKSGQVSDESNSIKNQRDMILDFVNNNPDIQLYKILSDDGFTGADFDRDAFKDVIDLIESGTVNCVIVKDFSRLGRDHIEMGKYIERYFNYKNIRFISINDNYDSLKSDMTDASNSLIVPFKNIVNEAFLEDISTKTKSQLEIKRKNGEFVCNYAAFGYTKTADKKLAVDEFASEVVKTIFEWKLNGYNEQQIANMLNEKCIHSPAEYKKMSGQKYHTPFAINEKSLWTANAIKRILKNRVYIGCLEQGKRTKASYRVKKCFYKPREAWSVHENNHEPIISELDFELVQELMARDTRVSGETGQLQLFSGLIICGACGQPMTVKIARKNDKKYINYVCATHKRFGTCKNNNVSSRAVEQFTLLAIRNQIAGLLSAEKLSGELMLDGLKTRKKAALEGMIEKSLRSIEEYNGYLIKSYAHMLDGVITETEYKLFRDEFSKRVDGAEQHIAYLHGEIKRLEDDTKTRALVERFKEHGNITALDRRALVGMVQSIIVNDNKNFEIRYRYAGGLEIFSESLEYDTEAIEAIPERMVM